MQVVIFYRVSCTPLIQTLTLWTSPRGAKLMGLGVQSFNLPPPTPPKKKKACVNSKQYMLEGVRIKWHVYLRFQFLHLIVMQNTFAPPVFSSLLLFSSPSTHPGCHQHELPSACQTPGISRTSDGESGDAKWIHADIYIYININTYIHIYIYPLQTWLDGHTFLTLPYLHQRFTRNQLSFRPMAAYISH